MAGRDVIERLKIVAAVGVTIAVLTGVAVGMVLAQSFWGAASGIVISLGFYISWYFFDTWLWSRRSGYLRTLLLAIGISIPCMAFSLAALISNFRNWGGFLIAALVVLAAWGLLALIFWIFQGFSVKHNPLEEVSER